MPLQLVSNTYPLGTYMVRSCRAALCSSVRGVCIGASTFPALRNRRDPLFFAMVSSPLMLILSDDVLMARTQANTFARTGFRISLIGEKLSLWFSRSRSLSIPACNG